MRILSFSRRSAARLSISGAPFFLAALLSGCTPPPTPPSPGAGMSAMRSELLSSVQQIAGVTRELRAANNVAFRPDYRGFPLQSPDTGAGHPLPLNAVQPAVGLSALPDGSPLKMSVYTQWSGPLSPFLRVLAGKMGWRYADHLTSAGFPDPDVAINADHDAVLSVLREAARQTPSTVTIRVLPGQLILEHRGGLTQGDRGIPAGWLNP